MEHEDWYGTYRTNGWKGVAVEETFLHPAKFPFGVVERIYATAFARNWLSRGGAVLDPFGGVGLGALHANLLGLTWYGVELEQKFVDIGTGYRCSESHICLRCTKERSTERKLVSACVNAQRPDEVENAGRKLDEYRRNKTDTPCGKWQTGNLPLWRAKYAAHFHDFGRAHLVQGDSRDLLNVFSQSFSGIVSSPPYSSARIDGNGDEGSSGLRNDDGSYLRGTEGWEKRKSMGKRYGEDPANLGNMPVRGIISSPPYSDSLSTGEGPGARYDFKTHRETPHTQTSDPNYGSSRNNIGNSSGDTFWGAARTIVSQGFELLQPGGVAIWVTGDYRRDHVRQRFGEQWCGMCEAVGFEPMLHSVAWKTERLGTQLDIFGNSVPITREYVSQFRRLDNRRHPEDPILNEDVWFMRKPL